MATYLKENGRREFVLFLILLSLGIACSPENTGRSGSSGSTGTGTGTGAGGAAGDVPYGKARTYPSGSGASTQNSGGIDDIGNACASVNVNVSRITPVVMFVIDRSASMSDAYPGSDSKWQALYDALMDPTSGVITRMQNQMNIGMTIFDGGEDTDPVQSVLICLIYPRAPFCGGTGYSSSPNGQIVPCPRLVTIDPAINNFNAINDKYKNVLPGGLTPTALALQQAYQSIQTQVAKMDVNTHPTPFVILATDGEPNLCSNVVSAFFPDFQGTVDAVTQAAGAGVKTYIVSIAIDPTAEANLDSVANAGNTGSPAFPVNSKDELVTTLTGLIGNKMGCSLQLNGRVEVGRECQDGGYVKLNDQTLECNGANGWKLTDTDHIQLQGNACTQFLGNSAAVITAAFPCDVVVIK
jgi:hypothetical protein